MNPLFENAGLEPSDEREGGYLPRLGETESALFGSTGLASGDHTQMGVEVEDLDALVADLRRRGAKLESYEFPGVEGNLIGFAELVR